VGVDTGSVPALVFPHEGVLPGINASSLQEGLADGLLAGGLPRLPRRGLHGGQRSGMCSVWERRSK
jgi:hypothetical protein